jgi:hypothetical protein
LNYGTSTVWALSWLGNQPHIPSAKVNNTVITIPRGHVLIAHSFALESNERVEKRGAPRQVGAGGAQISPSGVSDGIGGSFHGIGFA